MNPSYRLKDRYIVKIKLKAFQGFFVACPGEAHIEHHICSP